MDLSVIIVNYNMKELVCECLESLRRAAPALEWEAILVDNDSSDGSVEELGGRFPELLLIGNKHNAGFAAACNQGAKAARGELLLFLNPDTEAPAGTLEAMVGFLRGNPRAAAAGCKNLNTDGSIEPSLYRFPTLARTAADSLYLGNIFGGYEVKDYSSLSGRPRVEVICGACFMIKKDVFDTLGGFDEEMWMYGEDVELCLRIRRAGYSAHYLEDVHIIHKRGQRHLQEDSHHDMERIAYSHYKWIFYYYEKHCSSAARAALRALLFMSVYPKLASRKKRLARGDDSRDNTSRIKALQRVMDEFILRRDVNNR